MNEAIISYAFSRLNDINNGNDMFEIFCQKVIPKEIDTHFLLSSGGDAGGDGGIDGWSPLGDGGKIKYAFSINKKAVPKIRDEIAKTKSNDYKAIRLFTNQPVAQRIKEGINNEYNDIEVTIYDLENLVEFVKRNEELSKYIDLPSVQAGVNIDYLRKHNPLKTRQNEILRYIPRSVSFYDEESRQLVERPLEDLIHADCVITIVTAPAGYGKTCALEQIHQGIIAKKKTEDLPPAFVRLSDYFPGSLRQMIDDSMSASGDYRCADYLLLLDGYDEVNENDAEKLVKEIAQVIGNKSYVRRVIITAREYTQISQLEQFDSKQNVSLKPISRDDVKDLFKHYKIETADDFWKNSFFSGFSSNVFYVVKFIEYYKDRGTIANDVNELFSFLVEQETKRLFRKKQPSPASLESLALHMVLYQRQSLGTEENKLIDMLDMDYLPTWFKFSHNSIQEYLAAKKISKQSLEVIKKILAKGDLLIPHLTNTIEFVFNILLSNDYKKFEELLNWCIQGMGNAKRLLQIEADKISYEMNHQIFKAVMEQESKIGDLWARSDNLLKFMLQNEASVQANIKFLIKKILSFKDVKGWHYYTLTLQELTYKSPQRISEAEQRKLLKFFLELLKSENIDKNSDLIDSLLYSLCHHASVEKLNKKEICFIVDQILSIEKDSLFNNLCLLVGRAAEIIDSKTYFQLFKFIIERRKNESGGMAYLVPSQISDNQHHEPIRHTNWNNFIPLTEQYIKCNEANAWEVLKFALNNFFMMEHYDSITWKDFNKLFAPILSIVNLQDNQSELDDEKIALLAQLLFCKPESFGLSSIWEPMRESLNDVLVSQIIQKVIATLGNTSFYPHELMAFHREKIVTIEQFKLFKENYLNTDVQVFAKYFDSFCLRISKDHAIYAHMLSEISDELKDKIKEHDERIQQQSESEKRSILNRKSYSVAFNAKELVSEIDSVFSSFDKEIIGEDDLYRTDEAEKLSETNQFVLYFLRNRHHPISKSEILEYVLSPEWGLNFMGSLVKYCAQYQISLDDFEKEEIDKCITWMKLVLDKWSLETTKSPLKNVHVTLSYLLRNMSSLSLTEDFVKNYRDKIIGLTFCGFPIALSGSYIVSYESFALEYLEKYLSPKRIIAFIVNNLTHAFKNNSVMLSVCGYLCGRKADLFLCQEHVLKQNLIKYLNENIASQHISAVTDLAFAVGMDISDLDRNAVSSALVFNENENKFSDNFATSFVTYQKHEKNNDETTFMKNVLREAFDRSEHELLKKTLAEYYLSICKHAGKMFVFYADYLLSDKEMSRSFGMLGGGAESLATADISHLDKVQELFLYSRAKKEKSDRRRAILNIALASYKLIASNISYSNELDKIIGSMKAVAKDENHFMFRHIQEIENAFAEKTYVLLTVNEIAELD